MRMWIWMLMLMLMLRVGIEREEIREGKEIKGSE